LAFSKNRLERRYTKTGAKGTIAKMATTPFLIYFREEHKMTLTKDLFQHQPSVKHKHVLLMTATITPPDGAPMLRRIDPELRLQDYETALKFYLKFLASSIDMLIFAENSNSDISSLQAIVEKEKYNDQVEFICFDGLDYPPSYDRAYGEFKMIEYVMEHSQIIRNLASDAVIWKVTGRYIVKNIRQVIAQMPENTDLYCNFRSIPKRWAEMYLIAWTHKGYQVALQNIYHDLKPLMVAGKRVKSPEEVFIDLIEQRTTTIELVPRFSSTPKVDGIRAWTNENFLEGKNLLKFYIRSFACKVFPWLWI
jgi:hypothetical protein